MIRWQWHQLDHMEIICTSLQTDNHTSTSPLSFYRPDALPASQPTASKHWRLQCTHLGRKLTCCLLVVYSVHLQSRHYSWCDGTALKLKTAAFVCRKTVCVAEVRRLRRACQRGLQLLKQNWTMVGLSRMICAFKCCLCYTALALWICDICKLCSLCVIFVFISFNLCCMSSNLSDSVGYTYRVGQIKWYHLSCLLITIECICKI